VELGKTVSFKPLKTIDELTIKEWFDSTYAREKEPFLLTEQNESNSNLEQRLW
jgi:hypothetical protein